MRPLVAIVSARFRLLLQYRAAALAGLTTQVVFGLIFMMVYQAFYRSGAVGDQPLSIGQVVTYVWLGQALLGLLPWNGDPEIRTLVRSGGVAYELLRPVDLYTYWYARAVALRTAPTLLRAVPMVILAMTLFGMKPPADAGSAVGFAIVMAGALAMSCAITVLVGITLMWTVSGEGIVYLLPSLVTLLSGMLVPIPLFPLWAQPILEFLPFSALVDAPYRVYLGHIPFSELGPVVFHQWAWIAVLVLAGRTLLKRGLKRMVVQGG